MKGDMGEIPQGAFAVWQNFAAINGLVLSFPEGEDGGVIELRGDNGQGKSTAISSLQALAEPEMSSKLFGQTPTDGQPRGWLRVPGLVVNIYSKKTTFDPAGGRVHANILNGGPLGRLIDPRLKGDKPRSEARNKALAELVDLALTDAALEALSKGEAALKVLVPRGANLLEAADLIREKAQDLARQASTDAEVAGKEAERLMGQASDVELKIREVAGTDGFPEDIPAVPVARAAHEAAVRAAESARISNKALQDLLEQRTELEPLRTPTRPDVKPIDSAIDEIDDELPTLTSTLTEIETERNAWIKTLEEIGRKAVENERLINDLEARLEAARREKSQLEEDGRTYRDALSNPVYQDAALQARREEITEIKARREELKRDRVRVAAEAERWDRIEDIFAKPLTGYASDEQVYEAEIEIDEAAKKLEQAQLYQQMMAALDEHTAAATRAAEYAKLESWYRDIGWTVIPNVIAERLKELGIPGIDMRAGVLYGEHPLRGMIPFDELSPGQQIRLALQVALRGHDPEDGPAILPFAQEHWDALTPRNRAILRYEARRSRVWIVTATARYNGALRVAEDVPEEEIEVLRYIEQHGERLPEAEAFMPIEPETPAQARLF